MTKVSPSIEKARKEIVQTVIDDIQNGNPLFWNNKMICCSPNINALTNKPYRGVNRIYLFISMLKHYKKTGEIRTDNRWMTFKQLTKKGYHLKKGAKGTLIEYYDTKKIDIHEYLQFLKDNYATKEKIKAVEDLIKNGYTTISMPFTKGYVVFNGEDIEGLPQLEKINKSLSEKINDMETMIKNSEAKISHIIPFQGFINNYQPASDTITLGVPERFKDNISYYATAAHEIAHSTGHQKRLARDGICNFTGFGSEGYAKEELRAEITSMFIGQEYGFEIDQEHINNHKAYLQSWIKVLKNNPDELWKAANDAEKAVEYIQTHMINRSKELEQFIQILPILNLYANTPNNTLREKIDTFIATIPNCIIKTNNFGNYEEIIINNKSFKANDKGLFSYNFTEIKPLKEEIKDKTMLNYKIRKPSQIPAKSETKNQKQLLHL